MSVLTRYILAQAAKPMAATLLVALLVLLAERMLRVVDLVIGWRGSLLVVFEMLGYLCRITWGWPCRRRSSSAS